MPRINPNSSIRSGYKFEDLFLLKLCGEWLIKPELFTRINIQYVPDEIDLRRFSIDDIVLTHANQSFRFYQLKHKQQPDRDLWTFNELFDKGLPKWIRSMLDARGVSMEGAYLITNGHPADDVLACLQNDRIDFTLLQSLYPQVADKLLALFSLDEIEFFFNSFAFLFSLPERAELEKEIREYFYYNLHATKDGVNNLLLYIGDQGNERYPKEFTLSEIRNKLRWDNPRPLNQNFEIPFDFEFFDKHQHEQLIERIKEGSGGIQVIIGKPGTGKSTYLSKLYGLLKSKYSIAAARHHYHLNPKDSSFRERLNADRVKEALKAEFKKYKEEILGDLAVQNTEFISLREFIQKISLYYFNKKQVFVLIIDGLDHVIREGKNEFELISFLNEILYPQPGFFVLLGTQESATQYFSNIIHSYCPKERWIEIKGLKREAVEKVIMKNQKTLLLTADKEYRKNIAGKIYQKTAGNPLHLRYVLTQLTLNGGISHRDDLDFIVPYKDDIKIYYEELWRQLSVLSKSICFCVILLDYRLQEEELIELASHLTPYPAEVQESFLKIRHLIKADLFGIAVYHNSFMFFLTQQQDLRYQKKALYGQIKNWLEQSSNEELKWTEFVKVEYYLGNHQPLLNLSRDWVIDSFLRCYDEQQIESLLHLAAKVAFKQNKYEKVVYLKTIESSFSNRYYNLYSLVNKMWVLSFQLQKENPLRYPDFAKLNHSQIKQILLSLNKRKQLFEIPDEAIDRFNELLSERDYEQSDIIKDWLDILATFESITTKKAYQFVIQAREDKASASYFSRYCSALLRSGQENKIKLLLKEKLTKEEKYSIASLLMHVDLNGGIFFWKETINRLLNNQNEDHFYSFYRILSGETILTHTALIRYEDIPEKFEFHSIHSANDLDLYRNNFYKSFVLGSNHQEEVVEDWLKMAPDRYPIQVMMASVRAAIYLSTCLNERKKCELQIIIETFSDLRLPDFHDDHDLYELRRKVIPDIIKTSINLSSLINIHIGAYSQLTKEDGELLAACKWLYRDDLVELFETRHTILSDEAFLVFKEKEIGKLQDDIITFKDRAERFYDLADLARKLEKTSAAKELLRLAANNLIGYGHHKDMTLDAIMRSIEICGENGSNKVNEYLEKIAPFVCNIRNVTDGDETGSFIYEYAELLVKFNPQMAYRFYFEAVTNNNYYLEETVFADILSSLDVTEPVAKAVAGTAVDSNSYNALLKLAENHAGFGNILKDIQRVFGPIDYIDHRRDSNYAEQPTGKRGHKKQNTKSASQKVSPEKLEEYLDTIKGSNYYNQKYERSKYMLEWLHVWLTPAGTSNSRIIQILRGLFENHMHEINEDVLDYIYPYAYRTDREFAFECLVWATANSGSWGMEYIRKMEESRKRWQIALSDFPEKKEDYFKSSVQMSGKKYGDAENPHIPIPKATQFFIDCGELRKAEEITEFYISMLFELFPGVNLPIPEFLQIEKQFDAFDILVQRFRSLTPPIRERAGWHISHLLEEDESGETHQRFVSWLQTLELENLICNGLMLLIKSLQNKKSYSYKHVNASEIGNQIQKRCRATDLLILKMCALLKQKFRVETLFVISISIEKADILKEKFLNKLGSFLPLAYIDYINRFESESGMPVWNIWYCLYREECKNLSLKEEREDKTYANERQTLAVGRTNVFTDIFYSTFFRLIDYLAEIWILNEGDIFHYTLRNFPVDISFWQIPLHSKPSWWPQFKTTEVDETAFENIELLQPVSAIISKDRKEQLIHLNGYISHTEGFYENKLEGEIHLTAFTYEKGITLPDAELLFLTTQQQSGFWVSAVRKPINFSTLR